MSETRVPARNPVKKKPRYIGIDIVKILACMLVVSVHFFLYTGFYTEPITPQSSMTPMLLRWITYCCVPLFMITTGYLMKNKRLEPKYYLGLIRVLVLYIVISIICMIFNHRHYLAEYTAWDIAKGFLMFTNAQYAWYVEYYVCLFALIPFLNTAFNAQRTFGKKLMLVITVSLLSIVSQSLYIGIDLDEQIRVFPGYFIRCYPIAYYFIGAIIRDHPPKRTLVNKLTFLLIYVISLLWVTKTTMMQSLENTENNLAMRSWHYNDYGSWPVALCSVMLFLMLFDIRCKNKIVRFILKTLSNATFACYLISYVFDSLFYTQYCFKYFDYAERMSHWYEIVPKIFGLSMLSGLLLQGLYDLFAFLIRLLIHAVKQTAKKEAEITS